MGVTDWAARRWAARRVDNDAFERFMADHTPFREAVEADRQRLRSRIMELGGNRQDLRMLSQYERTLQAWSASLAAALQDPELRAAFERRFSASDDGTD